MQRKPQDKSREKNYHGLFNILKFSRIVSSLIFLGAFTYIFIRSLDPFSTTTNYFLRSDPLIFLTNIRFDIIAIAGILILIILTLFFGRIFCGWICPLGTLIDIIDRINIFSSELPLTTFRFSRYPPSLFILGIAIPAIFYYPPILQFFHPNIWIIRVFSLSLPGIVFILILAGLSFISKRFWCRYICPLGAFYGILAKFSLFGLRMNSCTNCKRCNLCPMAASDYKKNIIYRNQCILCFEFEANCPAKGFTYSLIPKGKTQHNSGSLSADVDYNESRRDFLKTAGILAGGIVAGSIISMLKIPTRKKLLRPPGVLNETQFVERCLRCFQCVRSCPNEIIKITGLESGLSNFLTPHLSFDEYGCDFYCQVCQTVCPNEAIPIQSLNLKQITPIGKARIDISTCIVFVKDTNCLVCEEFCPIPEKAIVPMEKNFILRYPQVIKSRCIGCGICEANCPVKPSAIKVYA